MIFARTAFFDDRWTVLRKQRREPDHFGVDGWALAQEGSMRLRIGLTCIIVSGLALGGVATASASLPNRSSPELESADTTPPSAPRRLDAAADVGCGNFFLDWRESRDNVDPQWALRYDVYMDGELVPGAGVIGDYFVELSVDVEPGSSHTFVVRAVDRSGNVSEPSNVDTEADTCS
jgi:hypothetical protein